MSVVSPNFPVVCLTDQMPTQSTTSDIVQKISGLALARQTMCRIISSTRSTMLAANYGSFIAVSDTANLKDAKALLDEWVHKRGRTECSASNARPKTRTG
jgi:hypothetical protein